jgi:hypothetical protein
MVNKFNPLDPCFFIIDVTEELMQSLGFGKARASMCSKSSHAESNKRSSSLKRMLEIWNKTDEMHNRR